MFQLYGAMYLLETRMYAATKFGESDDITLNRCYCRRLYDVIAIRLFFPFAAQGICPGNRLRLLVGQYDTGGCLVGSRPDLTISEDGIQRHGKRRSWHVQPNRVSYLLYDTIIKFMGHRKFL